MLAKWLTRHKVFIGALVVLGATVGLWLSSNSSKTLAQTQLKRKKSYVQFTKKGELVRPTGYRKWVYFGTPITPNDMNNGKAAFPEFHVVYMDPGSYAKYEKTGKFPDGTVIVKELVTVGKKRASSGKGYFMGKFTGLEVSIKSKKRFPKEPGNWAYFSFGHKYPLKKKVKAQPKMNCNSCHENLAQQDFVFTQYYPVLQAARKAAKKN